MPLTTRCWLATQVELQGQYTNRQLQDFARYHASTPWWRVIVTLVITPLPCVLCVILVDTLRLEPPTSSSLESPMFWTRAFLFTIAMTLSTLEHFRQHVLDLNFSLPLMLSLTLIVSTTTVGAGIVMSILIGYPMPFTIVIVTFPWFLILTTGIAATKWQQLATNKRLIVSALRYLLVCMCQIVITVFYPLYNHAFKRMTPIPQTLFVLVLPLFKIAAKNWIARALDSADVGKPEAVVFNVELFHALYVAFCMQNTTSTGTIAVIMGIDFVQSVVSFSDIENIAKNIRVDIAKEDQATDFLAGGNDMRRIRLADHLLAFIVDEVGTLQPPPMPQQSKGPRLASVSPLPLPKGSLKRQSSTGLQNLKRAEHSGLMDHMQHLLFVTEFVVLVEFTEVVMPIIYNCLLVALYQLPNREYYTFLMDLSPQRLYETLTKVSLYASLELLSLILFTVHVWWKLGFSLLHQLAFVLEKRQRSVQSKLVVWVTYVMQCSITHFGADYSFRFEWLRRHPKL